MAPRSTCDASRSVFDRQRLLRICLDAVRFSRSPEERLMGRRILLAILTLFAVAPAVQAQATGRIVGRVTGSADGRSLPGIQITVTGTTRGAISDTAGRFTITGVPGGSRTVLARGIGF
jgi:hypothetical protein